MFKTCFLFKFAEYIHIKLNNSNRFKSSFSTYSSKIVTNNPSKTLSKEDLYKCFHTEPG
jgi:hypothetical protein